MVAMTTRWRDGGEGLAHQLVREWTVDFGCVEESNAEVDGRADHFDSLFSIHGRTVAEGETHAAEAEGGNFQLTAEFASLHGLSFDL